MDKKFLKILALSAITVALEGSGAKVSAYECEELGLMNACKGYKDCKVIKNKCYTKCSVYTKKAKKARQENKASKQDFCSDENDACVEGKWLGMFKCRNKNLQPSEDKDE